MAAALVIAAALLGLISAVRPAGAAFPGTNGKIVFESSRLGGSNIFTMNPDGTGVTLLTDKNDVNPKEDPAVSPDGSKIAYVYGRDIWVMNSDGSGPRNLTNDADFNAQPAWSADGTKIAFAKDFDLFTMNADGTGKTNITNTPNNQEFAPAWSPDGSQIAYTRSGCEVAGGGGSCVYKTNADGTGTPTNLTTEPGHKNVSRHPSWSPDGTKIAFRGVAGSVGTTGTDIWVMNSDGSAKTDIINDNGTDDDKPAFSPDGQQIVFESNQDNNSGELYTISATGGAISRLTTNTAFDENADWQPIPVCTITGTPGDDIRTCTQNKDVICGLGGNDTINGAGGNDILLGGGGNDMIRGGADNDIVNGGPGTDTASYSSSATAVRASLASGFATGEGSDLLSGGENLTGSASADNLTGSAGANVLHGLGNNDTVVGGRGSDRLFGEGGADVLKARDGVERNDRLDGGPGNDTCQKDPGDTTTNCP